MAIEVRPHMELERFCAKFPTVKAAAEALGTRPNYLGEVLKRRRNVPDTMLKKLGLRKAVVKA